MLGIRTRRPPPFGGIHINDDKDIQIHRPDEASRNSLWAEGRLLLRDLIFALMIAALVVVFVVQPVKVEGTSMLPRLHDGERIFVNKLIYYDEYRWAPKIERGDIVVFWFPDDPSKSYIKRVVGLPGRKGRSAGRAGAHQRQCSRREVSGPAVESIIPERGANNRQAKLLFRHGRQSRQFQRLAQLGTGAQEVHLRQGIASLLAVERGERNSPRKHLAPDAASRQPTKPSGDAEYRPGRIVAQDLRT